jgi:hypothetical protein
LDLVAPGAVPVSPHEASRGNKTAGARKSRAKRRRVKTAGERLFVTVRLPGIGINTSTDRLFLSQVNNPAGHRIRSAGKQEAA